MGHIYQTATDNVSIDRRLLPSGTKVVVSTADAKKIAGSAIADELTDLGPGLVFSGAIALTTLADDEDVVATVTPGFPGRVVAAFAVASTAVTTAAKSANVRVTVDGTPLNGGLIQLTSAKLAAVGNTVGASTISDQVAQDFGAADNITFVVEGAPVDFTEGAVLFGLLVAPIRKDGAAVV